MNKVICLHFILGPLLILACAKAPGEPELPGPPQLLNNSLIQMNLPGNFPTQASDFASDAMGNLNLTFAYYFDSARQATPIGEHPYWTWNIDFSPFVLLINATVLIEDAVSWEILVEAPGLPRRLLSNGITNSSGKSGSWDSYDDDAIKFASVTWLRDNREKLEVNSKKGIREK